MKMQEAINQGYTIIVRDAVIADRLRKRYKKGHFVSINASMYRFDGIRKIYIDENLKHQDKVCELGRMVLNVKYGKIDDWE